MYMPSANPPSSLIQQSGILQAIIPLQPDLEVDWVLAINVIEVEQVRGILHPAILDTFCPAIVHVHLPESEWLIEKSEKSGQSYLSPF
jgi:hypothetical protein